MKSLLRKFSVFCIILISLFFVFIKSASASEPIGEWELISHLPYLLASHVAFTYGDKLYVAGGSAQTGHSHNDVLSNTVGINGSLQTWLSESPLPNAPIYHSFAQANNYVYILGGLEENPGSELGYVNKVFLGTLSNQGSVAWLVTNSLPASLSQGGAAVIDKWIYYMGGLNNSGTHKDIYFAQINTNGTLSSWSTSAITLPFPARSFGVVVYQDNIYMIGGVDGGGNVVKFVYKTTVNPSDGTLSAWEQLESLPAPDNGLNQSIIIGKQIITVGGGDNFGLINKVYYTDIQQDGTLSSWQESANPLPSPNGGGAVAYTNGYLYFIGGTDTITGYTDKIYYTKVNADVDLNVPLFKQTDLPWRNNIYDTANIWSPGNSTINAWGCALTSAAMVFRYFGINKLPGNISLDPGTLNTWLKGQVDGYVGNGLVNWIALSRLSKIAKSLNPTFTDGDALEYTRYAGGNKTQLALDINHKIPGILEEPGHFIVAKGTIGSTFSINDPFYNRSDLTSYGNTFLSLNRFVPSHTDLSYIMATVDSSLDISLKTSTGSAVGDSFIQQPLDSDDGGGSSGPPIKISLLQQPTDSKYLLNISSSNTKTYNFKVYLYDKDGNIKIVNLSGVVNGGTSDSYTIKFNHDNFNSSTVLQDGGYGNLIEDIKSLCYMGEVNNVYCASMLLQAQTASKTPLTSRAGVAVVKGLLNAMLIEVKNFKGKGISQKAYDILYIDLTALLTNF